MASAISWPALASAKPAPHVLTSSTPPDRLVAFPLIDAGWLYQGGDDPRFAAADFDDSAWATLGPSEVNEIDREAPGDIAWLRREIVISPSMPRPLFFVIAHWRPVELYADGRLIYKSGDVELAARGGDVEAELRPLAHPIELEPGRHVLAARLGMTPAPFRAKAGPIPGMAVGIGTTAHLADFQREMLFLDQMRGLFIGATLALSLIHFLLFLYIREQRANAYYAWSSFSVSLTVISGLVAENLSSLWAIAFIFVLTKAAVVWTCVFGLRFYYQAFEIEMPKRVWILRGIGGFMTLASFVITQNAVFVFALFALAEQMRVLVTATKQGKRGAWILLLGGGASIGASVVQLLSMLHILQFQVPQLLYLYGFMLLLISMSIYLARNFADAVKLEETLRELETAHNELRRAQAQLAQSERMASLGQLVAGIAHEINTPIGAIASIQDSQKRALVKLTEVIDSELGEAAKQHKKLASLMDMLRESNRVVEVGSTRVGALVKRLKTFARLDEAELKPANIHEGLDDTLMLLDHELRGVVEVVKEYGVLPEIACYPAQLNQVFMNLIHNARQSIEGKGKITITTSVTPDRALIKVRDTGAGIPRENLKRIFDPGFTTKGVRVGAGLGLAICYRIVESHQGELTVDSEVGAGTVFTVSIPLDLQQRLAKASAG